MVCPFPNTIASNCGKVKAFNISSPFPLPNIMSWSQIGASKEITCDSKSYRLLKFCLFLIRFDKLGIIGPSWGLNANVLNFVCLSRCSAFRRKCNLTHELIALQCSAMLMETLHNFPLHD